MKCLKCDRIFNPKRKETKFCSVMCANRYNSKSKNSKREKCPVCLKEIRSNNLDRHIKAHKRKTKSKPKMSKEDRIALSIKCLPDIPWNKGLTKETDARLKLAGEKIKQSKKANPQTFSQESIEKMRLAQLKNTRRRLRRKQIIYNGVTLDSTYELTVAKELDGNNIIWIQPQPLKYLFVDGLFHHYYLDFYLPDYGVYLDPKNDYLIKTQSEKVRLAAAQNNVIILILSKDELSWEKIKSLFPA